MIIHAHYWVSNPICTFKKFSVLLFILCHFLGSKNISLVGFDPNRPEYHFSRDEVKKLQIAKCLLKSNPWISAWDGRFESITKAKRISEHRLLERVAETLAPSPKSAVGNGWRLEEMKRGVDLTLKDLS